MTILSFGVFELDPTAPELRRQGRRVHLQEMPLRLLEALVERPGELVTREALYARLWPRDDSGILDDNLNTTVRKLRLALGDSAHRPRFIETVPKRGYRFLAPVLPRTAVAAAATANVAAPKQTSARSRRRIVAAALSLALAAIVAVSLALDALRLRQPAPGTSPPGGEKIATLAVLPFANASGRAEDEYFSDGLTEELTDRLSRSGRLRLVSRTSAFALKGSALDAREIGAKLGVDALVEGSVRRDGERLRISASLVSTRDGYQLWSDSYDRRLEAVFDVQRDIAVAIANRLSGRLLRPAEAAALHAPETDPAAYDLYLQGRFYWHRRTEDGLRAARRYFEQAVTSAPDYAPAWTGLGDAWAVLGFYDYLPPDAAFPQAREAALRALELEESNAAAEATLGYVDLYYDWDLAGAESRFRRATALRPGYSKAHQWYANMLTAAGRFDEAEQQMRRAQQSDPLSLIANAALGWVRYFAGRHREALDQYELTLALDRDFELAYLWSGWSLEALGELDAAEEMLEAAVERSGGSGISVAALARVRGVRGDVPQARRLLDELARADAYVPSYEIAKAWLALGETGEALAWLERAYDERSHSLVFLRVDPQLADLADDERFLRLAEQVMPGGPQLVGSQ